LLVVLAGLAVVIGYLYFVKREQQSVAENIENPFQQQYQQAAEAVPTVESSSDLDKVAKDLDDTSTVELDTELNGLNKDAAEF
jgi:hypothetical protein